MPDWQPGDTSPLLFGRLRSSANLAGHAFPGRMAENHRQELVQDLLKRLWPTGPPKLSAMLADTQDAQWEFLSERWLQEPMDLRHDQTRLLVDHGERFAWLLMGEDHIRLCVRARGEDLPEGARELDEKLAALESSPGLATDQEGRRLVANPFLCGSGCHGSLVLHLPGLAWWGHLEEQLDPLYSQGLSYRTWQEGFGDFLVLENLNGKAGSPESSPALRTLDMLMAPLALLQEAEQSARMQLKHHRRLEVEDRVNRALAACRAARLMGYPELVEHISLLRLGVQLQLDGWHLPILPAPVTPLLLSLAPAHLAARSDAGRDGRQASALRARLLRAALA